MEGRLWKPGIDGRRARALRALSAAVLLLLLFALFIPMMGGDESQLSAYSDHWNDISEMRRMVDSLGLASRSLLSGPRALSGADPENSVLVIMGVEKAYTAEERGAIQAFVRVGGNLLIADDFGYGGELLEALTGQHVGLRTEPLRDLRFSKNPDFVSVKVRIQSSLGIPAVDLLLNRPSALRMDALFLQASRPGYRFNPEVVANASSHAWLDVNQNLERDPDETEMPYPVAAFYTMDGGGRLLAVSDPGIFINDMMGLACNRQFVLSVLINLGRGRSTVIFDESRHSARDPAAVAGSAAVRVATGFLENPAAIFLAILLAFLLSLHQYSGIPVPAPRRHKDALGDPRLLHFRTPDVSPHEFRRLRVAVVEKVRLAYGIAPEEFYPAMLPDLPSMLSDPELQRFLDTESWPDLCSFGRALERAESWTPPPPSTAYRPDLAPRQAVEYAEVELVDDPPGAPLEFDAALLGGTGGVRLWDPGNRLGKRTEVDSLLYGGTSGSGGSDPRAMSGGGGK